MAYWILSNPAMFFNEIKEKKYSTEEVAPYHPWIIDKKENFSIYILYVLVIYILIRLLIPLYENLKQRFRPN